MKDKITCILIHARSLKNYIFWGHNLKSIFILKYKYRDVLHIFWNKKSKLMWHKIQTKKTLMNTFMNLIWIRFINVFVELQMLFQNEKQFCWRLISSRLKYDYFNNVLCLNFKILLGY